MGCTDSKVEAQVRGKYATHLQDSRVVAAMETLNIDRRDAGLRFYRLFAAIDTDESNSIGLDEFLKHLGLHRTPFAEQVFSNLDFVLNVWSFCTMGRQELIAHVFHIYDDDGNGVQGTAEVESLLRFVYQTETVSPKIAAMLEAADTDYDRLISKDDFFALCTAKRDLLAPVLALQARAQERYFGKAFWAKDSKKRPTALAPLGDVFAAFGKKLSENRASTSRLKPSSETTKQNSGQVAQQQTVQVAKAEGQSAASERLAQRQQAQELKNLQAWIEAQRQDPVVDDYLSMSCQKTLVDERLDEQKRGKSTAPEAVELLTQLRHSAAVNVKKFDAALVALKATWGEEERAAIEKRHVAIKSMVRGISAKTLLQQTGKSGAGAVVGGYLQKQDSAEADDRQEFRERWETLERAGRHLVADTKRSGEGVHTTNPPAVDRKVFAGKNSGGDKPVPAEYTKVVPIVDEVWAECFDADSQRVYYVSFLGDSSWDPLPSFQRQW